MILRIFCYVWHICSYSNCQVYIKKGTPENSPNFLEGDSNSTRNIWEDHSPCSQTPSIHDFLLKNTILCVPVFISLLVQSTHREISNTFPKRYNYLDRVGDLITQLVCLYRLRVAQGLTDFAGLSDPASTLISELGDLCRRSPPSKFRYSQIAVDLSDQFQAGKAAPLKTTIELCRSIVIVATVNTHTCSPTRLSPSTAREAADDRRQKQRKLGHCIYPSIVYSDPINDDRTREFKPRIRT